MTEIKQEEIEVENSIEDDIRNAMKEVSGDAPKDDDSAELVEKEINEEPKIEEPKIEELEVPAPQAWGKDISDKWKDLPVEIRNQIAKREQEVHQAFTRHDNERLLGKEIKDIVTPYMPLIQAAGSTPTNTISNLLNTAYRLQTGDANTKAQLIKQIAQDYGVNLSEISQEQEYTDPTVLQLRQEIEQLKQTYNPQEIEKRLKDTIDHDKVISEVNAFASNPENKYYESVKPQMAILLGNGQAKDLKEAYEMAIWANPSIRSTLLAEQQTAEQAKRKAEIAAKKNAASSITGSPAIPSNTSKYNPKSTVEDDLRAAFAEFKNRI